MTQFRTTGGSSVTINGRTFSGRDVSIYNGKVFVDGVAQDNEQATVFNVVVNGAVDTLTMASGNVSVNGDVNDLDSVSGDVVVNGNVINVKTVSGDVSAKLITGDVDTVSGDVRGVKR